MLAFCCCFSFGASAQTITIEPGSVIGGSTTVLSANITFTAPDRPLYFLWPCQLSNTNDALMTSQVFPSDPFPPSQTATQTTTFRASVVGQPTTVTVGVCSNYGLFAATTTFVITPPTLTLTVTPTVESGNSLNATLTINPPTFYDQSAYVTSADPSIEVNQIGPACPSSFTTLPCSQVPIPAGAGSATFSIPTSPVTYVRNTSK